MKKSAFAAAAFAAVLTFAATGCSNKADENATAATGAAQPVQAQPANTESFTPSTNIRYYNMDSVMANYDMVKVFNEANLRTMTELQNAQRSREAELQKLANNIQQKVQNNGYLSEASYNTDMAELNQKQQNAQNYLGALQQKAQEEAGRQQDKFLAELNAFLVEYNKEHHFDAILIYAPGELFNPALDITDDIISGLNKRYNASPSAETPAAAAETPAAK